jgi:hypothetical protein
MNIDRHWGPWTVASVFKHFKSGDLSNAKLLLEGQHRKSPQTLHQTYGEWIELRIDGPTWNFDNTDVIGRFEINALVMVGKSDKNIWRCRELMGYCEALFTDPIELFKYGTPTDPSNDQTAFDCLRRTKFRGTDNEIVSAYFGELDPKVPIEQATVEAHYILTRTE